MRKKNPNLHYLLIVVVCQILEAKGDIKAAIPVLQKGAILDPESRAIQQVSTNSMQRLPHSHYEFMSITAVVKMYYEIAT